MSLTLSVVDLVIPDDQYSFRLIDQETLKSYALNEQTKIQFNASEGSNMDRFLLSYNNSILLSRDPKARFSPNYQLQNGILKIIFKNTVEIHSIHIIDLSGREVYRSHHLDSSDHFEIPISQNGLHIIRMETSEGIHVQKIIF
jgi:hypothetical protein